MNFQNRHCEKAESRRSNPCRAGLPRSLCSLAMTMFILLSFISISAFAQDEAQAVTTDAVADDAQTRTELATKMHTLWPVATRVEEAIETVAENVPPDEREAFKARMRRAIDQKTLEEESIAAMAKVFTASELQAMVNFYGSAEGRAVSAKTEDYMKILQPVMVKMLDSALLKMRTGAPLQSAPAQPKAP